jgi:hypothetical protein
LFEQLHRPSLCQVGIGGHHGFQDYNSFVLITASLSQRASGGALKLSSATHQFELANPVHSVWLGGNGVVVLQWLTGAAKARRLYFETVSGM